MSDTPKAPEDEGPVTIAIRRLKPAKTAPMAPKMPKKAKEDSEGEVKINFLGKKPSRPTPVNSFSRSSTSVRKSADGAVKVVKKHSISVKMVDEPAPEPEPELSVLDMPVSQDLDLEDVFSELEQGASSTTLFDEFDNPLDMKNSAKEPLDNFASEPASEPAETHIRDQLTSSPMFRHAESPFISSVRVDKRPLSGARPTETPNNLIVEQEAHGYENLVPPKEEEQQPVGRAALGLGDLGNIRRKKPVKKPVETDIAAAPKKTSATIGLFVAILLTVIAGGFVGALIYFWFFQN